MLKSLSQICLLRNRFSTRNARFMWNCQSFEWVWHGEEAMGKKQLLIYTIHRYLSLSPSLDRLNIRCLFVKLMNFTIHRSFYQAEHWRSIEWWLPKIKYDSIAISNLLWISFILFLLVVVCVFQFILRHLSSIEIKRSVFNASFQIDLINIDEPNLDSISLVLLLFSNCGIFFCLAADATDVDVCTPK